MLDSQDWFVTGAALEDLFEWSHLLKSFQQLIRSSLCALQKQALPHMITFVL